MKKILLTATAALLVLAAQAQFTYDYLRAADSYYRKADYNSAAEYYEKYLASRKITVRPAAYNPYTASAVARKKPAPVSSQQQAVYQLAESYRQLHNYEKAAPWYEEALEFDRKQFPLAAYHYATSLRALGKYEEAEKAFNYFLRDYTQQDHYRTAAERELQNLHFILEQLDRKDLHLYTVNKTPLNATGATYAPVWLSSGALLFTSTRPDSGSGKHHVYINRLYQVGEAGGGIRKASLPQPRDEHQGVAAVTPDGNTMILTRWKLLQGKKTSALYISRKKGDAWSEPVPLDNKLVNTPGYNAQQPFIMPDGKRLLYASDKPGGQGGYDLWCAELDAGGKPVSTKNLGNVINTAADEQAPFFHAPSRTLVFAANGRIGMGGYDLFFSKGDIDSWSAPENFGYPVNSVKDDIYFASKSTRPNILDAAWLSSDRAAECCLELFALGKREEKVTAPSPPPPPVEVVKEEPPAPAPIVLDNVYYDFNMATLQAASYPALDKLVQLMQEKPDMVVELSAHTDNIGSDAFNQRLSEARARSCVDYLVSKGIDKRRLQYKGYGASRPVAPNRLPDGKDNPEGRQQNRRTEFRILN